MFWWQPLKRLRPISSNEVNKLRRKIPKSNVTWLRPYMTSKLLERPCPRQLGTLHRILVVPSNEETWWVGFLVFVCMGGGNQIGGVLFLIKDHNTVIIRTVKKVTLGKVDIILCIFWRKMSSCHLSCGYGNVAMTIWRSFTENVSVTFSRLFLAFEKKSPNTTTNNDTNTEMLVVELQWQTTDTFRQNKCHFASNFSLLIFFFSSNRVQVRLLSFG